MNWRLWSRGFSGELPDFDFVRMVYLPHYFESSESNLGPIDEPHQEFRHTGCVVFDNCWIVRGSEYTSKVLLPSHKRLSLVSLHEGTQPGADCGRSKYQLSPWPRWLNWATFPEPRAASERHWQLTGRLIRITLLHAVVYTKKRRGCHEHDIETEDETSMRRSKKVWCGPQDSVVTKARQVR